MLEKVLGEGAWGMNLVSGNGDLKRFGNDFKKGFEWNRGLEFDLIWNWLWVWV